MCSHVFLSIGLKQNHIMMCILPIRPCFFFFAVNVQFNMCVLCVQLSALMRIQLLDNLFLCFGFLCHAQLFCVSSIRGFILIDEIDIFNCSKKCRHIIYYYCIQTVFVFHLLIFYFFILKCYQYCLIQASGDSNKSIRIAQYYDV